MIGGTLGKAGIGTETVTVGRQRRHLLAVHAVHAAAAREGRRSSCRTSTRASSARSPSRARRRPKQIHAVAQGRVWTGRQALEHGLVDRLGGLDTAVSLAKERAKIPADEDVQLVVYPERRNFFDALSEQFGGTGSAGMWSMLAGTSERRAVAALSAPTRLFRRGEPLALMPFTFVR